MRITLTIENKLLDRAVQLTGINDTTLLVKLGLETLIATESNKRLASLGGTEKGLNTIPRRKPLKISSSCLNKSDQRSYRKVYSKLKLDYKP